MDINTILLIFFAIPLAIIIFSIALQKLFRNPFLVAGIIFAILLIIVLAFFDSIFLILVIAYTILAFITAVLTKIICKLLRRIENSNSDSNSNSNNCTSNTIEGGDEDLISVSTNDSQLLNSGTDYNSNCTCVSNRNRRF